jgi:hypothetical protein
VVHLRKPILHLLKRWEHGTAWVLVTNNSPRCERIALRAVTAKPLEMWVVSIVTTCAVESLTRGGRIELTGAFNL